MKNDYILRERDDAELARLKYQNKAWRKTTRYAFKKSKLAASDQIIDLGSGPGYLSFDLSKKLNKKGKIYAVDNSEKFIDHLNSRNLKKVKGLKLDIKTELSKYFKPDQIDKVYCRWVLMFMENVGDIIENIYPVLKKGGKFISMEYFRFHQIDIYPESEIFTRIYQNVDKLIKSSGGDPNIGSRIPLILKEKGFKNIQTFPIYRTGKPGSKLWKWLSLINENHINLVKGNLIPEKDLELYYKDWGEKSKSNISFITAPPLMITIGEK